MILEGFVDLEITERDFIDLCCSIGESLHFGIYMPKIIMENRQFRVLDSDVYKNKFSFYVVFPNNRGTKSANKKFVAEKMAHLLEVLLEKDLPVGLEDNFDTTGKKSFALLKVPVGDEYMFDGNGKKTFEMLQISI